jgi:hypothetical protein
MRTEKSMKSRNTIALWGGINWLRRATGISEKGGKSMLKDGYKPGPILEKTA